MKQYVVVKDGAQLYVGPSVPTHDYGELWVRKWNPNVSNSIEGMGDWGELDYSGHLHPPRKKRK